MYVEADDIIGIEVRVYINSRLRNDSPSHYSRVFTGGETHTRMKAVQEIHYEVQKRVIQRYTQMSDLASVMEMPSLDLASKLNDPNTFTDQEYFKLLGILGINSKEL